MDSSTELSWDPCRLLLHPTENYKYAVIVLNTPINITIAREQVLTLWKNALLRVTVDGGTDRWKTWLKHRENDFDESKVHPDLITGDMDSISPETLEFYKNQGTRVIVTANQDETDFTKAVTELKMISDARNLNIDYVLVFNNTSGRFDQIIANINTLYKVRDAWSNVKVFLISDCVTWLLDIGKHRIKIPETLKNTEEWCALMPIGKKAIISTTGLKWNLDNSSLEFGHMVSTSNTYKDTEVHIETDTAIVWSMGIKNLICKKCDLNSV